MSSAYIDSLLEHWPEPTPQQRKLVMNLVYGESSAARSGPSEYQLEQQRRANEREDALKRARAAALALTACDVCNLQPEQHRYAQQRGIDSHEWTPGRAEKILSTDGASK